VRIDAKTLAAPQMMESNYSVGSGSFFARCLLGTGRAALARSAAFLRCK
jgi:hypothetical protein